MRCYRISVLHDPFIRATCLIYTRDRAHFSVWHGLCIHVMWILDLCDMTHLYVRHDSFICETCLCIHSTWLIHMCDMKHSYMWHDPCIRATWHTSIRAKCLIRTFDMPHSYVRHVTWNIPKYDMTRSNVRHDSSIRATCLIRTFDMTHSYMRHDTFIHMTWLMHTCDMTLSYR